MKAYVQTAASLVVLALLAIAPAGGQQAGQPQPQPTGQQAPSAPAAPPSPEEQAAIQQIFQASDPQQRLALAEEFLAKYPQSQLRGRAYAVAAEACRMQNDYAKAVEYGEHAIEVNPRDAFSLILVADSLAEGVLPATLDYEEKLSKAENYAHQALEILPELFAAIPRRPEVPEEQYNLQKRYIEAQPHATLGFIYLRRNQNPQAEEELKLAVELNQWRPNPADFQRLGAAHMRQKEYAEAGAAFQRCAELSGPAAETCQKQLEQVQRLLKAQETPTPEKPQE